MKKLYILILSSFGFLSLGAQNIEVTFEVTPNGTDKKRIAVMYCASGGDYVATDGSDDWGSQVITIGFEPSSGVTAMQPNPNITDFAAGTIAFTDAFSGGSTINTYTPSLIGGANNGNVYVTFSISASTINQPLADGACMEVLSFSIPSSYGTTTTTEMFLNNVELSPAVETQAIVNNVGTGQNEFNGVINSSALPIRLSSFIATKQDRSVMLDWSTSSEINGSHFDVQRSQNLNDWTTVGTVEAVGESSSEQIYDFLDNAVPFNTRSSKTFYYRLDMIDNDGSQEYSDIRTVRFDQESVEFIVYPNPSVNEVFVSLSSITEETGPATMHMINMKGERVKEITLATNDDIRVDVSNVTPGVYYFVVNQGAETFTQKIVKIN